MIAYQRLQAACSGERPKCKRCARLNHECIYDSKTLHSRSPHTYRHHPAIRQRDLVPASRPQIPQNASSSNDTTGRVPNAMPLLDATIVPSDSDFGLPSSLIDTLVETYFTCVYNANLLLHKGLFLEQLAANRVPGHLLMSICAWGSVYVLRVSILNKINLFKASITTLVSRDLYTTTGSVECGRRKLGRFYSARLRNRVPTTLLQVSTFASSGTVKVNGGGLACTQVGSPLAL